MNGNHIRHIITNTNQHVASMKSIKMTMKRSVSLFTNNVGKEQQQLQPKNQLIHGMGVAGALMSVTAMVALSPLDEFEKVDPDNVCYHRHLHPR
jgi:flagellar motor component MotA